MGEVGKHRIAVVGAGAVGGVIGGLLAREGENVTLIARRGHAEAIRKNGLRIDGALGAFTVKVQAAEALEFRPDLVLLAAKMQDVEDACREIRPFVQGVPVMTLQNGIRSDDMAASLLGEENIISGVVLFNASFMKPGCVTYGVEGGLLIGEAFQKNGRRVEEIASLLGRALKTEISGNIQGVRWTKLLVNVLGNGVEAMTGMSFGDCMRHPSVRRAGVFILREAYRVGKKAGVRFEPLPRLPIAFLKFLAKSPPSVTSLVFRLTMGGMKTQSSTLQSLLKGRPTEIDYLNGEVVAQGIKADMETPYNAKVVELVHEVERTGRFFSPAALESRFFGAMAQQ